MTLRQQKEHEFFVHHMNTFKALGLADPTFVIKTAFYQKGKFGRQVQFYESELKKGEDIYVEFYDKVIEDGVAKDMVPMHADRTLFKYKANPFYAEEYEKKDDSDVYTIPVNELVVVNQDGMEFSYTLWEKRKKESENELPRLQNTLSIPDNDFPDFAKEFPTTTKESVVENDDAPLSEITIRDLAAIMLIQPVSNRQWLNELILKAKPRL